MTLMTITTILTLCYILVGYGCSKIFCNKSEPFVYCDEISGKFAIFLTVFLWPVELGRLIAKAYIYYNVRLNRINQGEYNCEPLAMLHHVYDIKESLDNKLTELSDVMTVNNPAWGSDSADEKKKTNLISLYTNHLINRDNIPLEQAYTKAIFIINNFKTVSVVNDIRSDNKYDNKFESEKALRISDFFIKEVAEKANSLKPNELYKPLYAAIAIKKWQKNCSVSQNTSRAFDSYSGKYGYDKFIEDAAIIYRLEQLGILRKDERQKKSGEYFYKIVESDLSKIRHIIFGDIDQSDYFKSDSYIEEECSRFKDDDLPFRGLI